MLCSVARRWWCISCFCGVVPRQAFTCKHVEMQKNAKECENNARAEMQHKCNMMQHDAKKCAHMLSAAAKPRPKACPAQLSPLVCIILHFCCISARAYFCIVLHLEMFAPPALSRWNRHYNQTGPGIRTEAEYKQIPKLTSAKVPKQQQLQTNTKTVPPMLSAVALPRPKAWEAHFLIVFCTFLYCL